MDSDTALPMDGERAPPVTDLTTVVKERLYVRIEPRSGVLHDTTSKTLNLPPSSPMDRGTSPTYYQGSTTVTASPLRLSKTHAYRGVTPAPGGTSAGQSLGLLRHTRAPGRATEHRGMRDEENKRLHKLCESTSFVFI